MSCRSNGAFRRSSHRPGGKPSARSAIAARIWRLIRLRVTARLACALRAPRCPANGRAERFDRARLAAKSSTSGGQLGASPADNSTCDGLPCARRCRAHWRRPASVVQREVGAPCTDGAASEHAFEVDRPQQAPDHRCSAGGWWSKRVRPATGACGPWRGGRRSRRGRHGSSCATRKPWVRGAADLRRLVGALHGGSPWGATHLAAQRGWWMAASCRFQWLPPDPSTASCLRPSAGLRDGLAASTKPC